MLMGIDLVLAVTPPEADGPAPWVAPLGIAILVIGVGLSLAALWWSFRRRHQMGAATTVDLAEHHRVRWVSDPDTFVAQPQHWPMGVAAIFGICAAQPWEQLRHSDEQMVRSQILEAWGVRSRPQMLAQLHWLLTRGHRVQFEQEVQHWGGLSDGDAAVVHRELAAEARQSEDAAEALWRFQRVRADERDIRSVQFVAWDFARLAMLCRAGATTGLLSDAEALDTIALTHHELHATYSGWAEMGEHFLRSRWYWASSSGTGSRDEDLHDASRQQALLAPGTGPWSQVPWDLSIAGPRVLLADAMIAEDLVEPQPPHEIYTEAGGYLDAAVRARTDWADPTTP